MMTRERGERKDKNERGKTTTRGERKDDYARDVREERQ